MKSNVYILSVTLLAVVLAGCGVENAPREPEREGVAHIFAKIVPDEPNYYVNWTQVDEDFVDKGEYEALFAEAITLNGEEARRTVPKLTLESFVDEVLTIYRDDGQEPGEFIYIYHIDTVFAVSGVYTAD